MTAGDRERAGGRGGATGPAGVAGPQDATGAAGPARATGATGAGGRAGPRLRTALRGLPSYQPGRPAGSGDRPTWKLSSNENPYPPLPSVLQVLSDAAQLVNRYPDMAVTALHEALAARFGVPVDSVATGTGSVGVLGQALAATVGPGDEVVFAWRSFEAYPIAVQISGATAVPVPLTPDERHDVEAMAAAVSERTRVILLCSPNNPTGTAIRRDEFAWLLDRVPDDVLVVLDEAYHEFVRDPQVPDGLDLFRARPNVAVLRTFSKAYGLAGLRVGYAIAREPVAAALRQTSVPFGVNSLAQAAAVASLQAEEELLDRVEAIVRERERVEKELAAQGWRLPPSQANFVWLRLGERTVQFAAECAQRGVTVRPFEGEGARVTVAEPAANDVFLEVAARFAT